MWMQLNTPTSRYLRFLGISVGLGVLCGGMAHLPNMLGHAIASVFVWLPFALAVCTGIAKTTTA